MMLPPAFPGYGSGSLSGAGSLVDSDTYSDTEKKEHNAPR